MAFYGYVESYTDPTDPELGFGSKQRQRDCTEPLKRGPSGIPLLDLYIHGGDLTKLVHERMEELQTVEMRPNIGSGE